MSKRNRAARTFFFISLLGACLIFSEPVIGQDQFKRGDDVEVLVFKKWVPGVVLRNRHRDLYDVQYHDENFGKKLTRFFRAKDIRRVTRTPGRSPNKEPADDPIVTPSTEEGSSSKPNKESATPRTWASSSGKFKIEAKLIADDGEKVVLEKTDGNRIDVPRNKLSKIDISYLDSLRSSNNPAAGNNPFENVTGKKARSGNKMRIVTSDPDESSVKAFDFSTTEPFNLSVNADTAKPRTKSFFLGDSIGEEYRPENSLVNASGSQLVFTIGDMFNKSLRSKIGVIDLKNGKASPLLELPYPQTRAQDVSPDGQVVLTMTTSNQGGQRLDAFRIEGDQLELIVSWNSGSNKDWSGAYKYARLLDSNRVLTLDDKLLEIIQIEPFQTLFKSEVDKNTEFAVSPDDKSILVYTNAKLFVVDAESGAATSAIETGVTPRTISISPKGKIALAHSGNIKILDSNGVMLNEFTTPFIEFGTSAYWLSDRLIGFNGRLGNVNVLDTKVGAWLIQYQTGSKDHTDHSGFLWRTAINKSRKVSVAGIDISKPDQLTKLDQLPESAMAFEPGDAVALDIQLPFDRKINDAVRTNLESQLQKLGLRIQPNANLKLSAYIKALPSYQISARINRKLEHAVATVQPSDSIVQLTKNNAVVWKRVDENRLNVHFGGAESSKQLQDSANFYTYPDTDFLKNIKIPKKVVIHRNAKPMALVWMAIGSNPKVKVTENW